MKVSLSIVGASHLRQVFQKYLFTSQGPEIGGIHLEFYCKLQNGDFPAVFM